MSGFLLNRFAQSIVLLVIVSIIGFTVLNFMPGGPLAQFGLDPGMTQKDIERLAEQLGLNRPLWIQYFDWAWRLVRGDWGHSFRDSAPVLAVIGRHLFATLLLMGTSTALAIAIGSWIGIRGATHRYSLFDYCATVGAMVALSVPTFWFGLIGIYIFTLKLGWVPAGNMYTIGDGSMLDYLHHLILPSLVLSLVHVAVWSRYMRTATLDALSQDFVKTARAKGLSERRILLKHVVGNALLPMITLAGVQLPSILTGALVTETIFTWPGMGRLFLDSLGYSDYPMVMGLLIFSAILVVLGQSGRRYPCRTRRSAHSSQLKTQVRAVNRSPSYDRHRRPPPSNSLVAQPRGAPLHAPPSSAARIRDDRLARVGVRLRPLCLALRLAPHRSARPLCSSAEWTSLFRH
ncbi:peptide/nickel transport system permease protein [Bradyrhizobium sp. LM2.7]